MKPPQKFGILIGLWLGSNLAPALALPPPDDQPEEVQRTEIITEARSPVDGKPLTAAQYAELQTQLQARRATPETRLNPGIRRTINLLRVRQGIRSIIPFAFPLNSPNPPSP
jgi:hypothetical protein